MAKSLLPVADILRIGSRLRKPDMIDDQPHSGLTRPNDPVPSKFLPIVHCGVRS
jgi:hypothetical protein